MSEEEEFSISRLQDKRQHALTRPADAESSRHRPPPPALQRPPFNGSTSPRPLRPSFPFDPRRILAAIRRHGLWTLLAAAGLGTAAFLTSERLLPHQAHSQIMPREPTPALDPGALTLSVPGRATQVSLLRSPELLAAVALNSTPSLTTAGVASCTRVSNNPGTPVITLHASAATIDAAVHLANAYATQAVLFTRAVQTAEARAVAQSLEQRLQEATGRMEAANRRFLEFSRNENVLDVEQQTETYIVEYGRRESELQNALLELETIESRIRTLREELARHSPAATRLREARDHLAKLHADYTDAHPAIISQRSLITELERERQAAAPKDLDDFNPGSSEVARTLYLRWVDLQAQRVTLEASIEQLKLLQDRITARVEALSRKGLDYFVLKSQLESARNARNLLILRQREVLDLAAMAEGYFRVFAPATHHETNASERRRTAFLIAAGTGSLGWVTILGLVVLGAVLDKTLRTRGDVTRVTGLPVLAALGDLGEMDAGQRDRWAFRAWTLLKGHLVSSPDRGIVCGIISSRPGEGRSTWVNLLAKAASQRGHKVLAIAACPSPSEADAPAQDEPPGDGSTDKTRAVSKNVLAFPRQVTEKLLDPNGEPTVHIPLPGWVWDLDRRNQWRSALDHWSSIDNLVMLIELPPASIPEAVLLAENLPQVLWLTASGMARAAETREQLETLRHAGCNLAGAVLNREPTNRA